MRVIKIKYVVMDGYIYNFFNIRVIIFSNNVFDKNTCGLHPFVCGQYSLALISIKQ